VLAPARRRAERARRRSTAGRTERDGHCRHDGVGEKQ
jgi:hypothetical protein